MGLLFSWYVLRIFIRNNNPVPDILPFVIVNQCLKRTTKGLKMGTLRSYALDLMDWVDCEKKGVCIS